MADYDYIGSIIAYRKDANLVFDNPVECLIGGYPIEIPIFEYSGYYSSYYGYRDFDPSKIPDNPLKIPKEDFNYTISINAIEGQSINNPNTFFTISKGPAVTYGLTYDTIIDNKPYGGSTIYVNPVCLIFDRNWGYCVVCYNSRDDEYDQIQLYNLHDSEFITPYSWTGIEYSELILINPSSSSIYLDVGESVKLEWGIKLGDDSVFSYDNITYSSSQSLSYSIEDNELTLLEIPKFPPILIRATANISGVNLFSIISVNAKGPYYPNGDSKPSGGNGSYGGGYSNYPTVNKIPQGTTEANDSATGMYTRYLVDVSGLGTMAEWLWSEDLGLQIAKTFISAIYGDPIQTVISCVSYPFQLNGLVGEVGTTLHWGGHDTGISMSRTSKNAFQINWGTIEIREHWGNFLDYSPHTQMQLYLPWGTGFVSLDPNDILNSDGSFIRGYGTLSVVTNIELSRGMCMHHVIANNTVIGTFSGACGRQIPMVGSDFASKQVALAGAAIGTMAAAVATGREAIKQGSAVEVSKNPKGQFTGYDHGGVKRMKDAKGNYHDKKTGRFTTKPEQFNYDVKTGKDAINRSELQKVAAKSSRPAVEAASAVGSSPASVTRSGSFQEGTGGMGIQVPYLLISIPKMSKPNNYGYYYGYPSNITYKLGNLSGYTEIGSIHLDGFYCTNSELEEIESLLQGGVIL